MDKGEANATDHSQDEGLPSADDGYPLRTTVLFTMLYLLFVAGFWGLMYLTMLGQQ